MHDHLKNAGFQISAVDPNIVTPDTYNGDQDYVPKPLPDDTITPIKVHQFQDDNWGGVSNYD